MPGDWPNSSLFNRLCRHILRLPCIPIATSPTAPNFSCPTPQAHCSWSVLWHRSPCLSAGKSNETRQTKGAYICLVAVKFLTLQHGLFVRCDRQAAKNLQNLLQSSDLGRDQTKVFNGYSLNAHCLAPG